MAKTRKDGLRAVRGIARRSWVAQSAYRTGGGPHRDGREARRGSRAQRAAAAVKEASDAS